MSGERLSRTQGEVLMRAAAHGRGHCSRYLGNVTTMKILQKLGLVRWEDDHSDAEKADMDLEIAGLVERAKEALGHGGNWEAAHETLRDAMGTKERRAEKVWRITPAGREAAAALKPGRAPGGRRRGRP